MEMKRQDFSFELPQELIAQDPLKDCSFPGFVLTRRPGKCPTMYSGTL